MCKITNQSDSQLWNFLDFHHVKFQYHSYLQENSKCPLRTMVVNPSKSIKKCQNKQDSSVNSKVFLALMFDVLWVSF